MQHRCIFELLLYDVLRWHNEHIRTAAVRNRTTLLIIIYVNTTMSMFLVLARLLE